MPGTVLPLLLGRNLRNTEDSRQWLCKFEQKNRNPRSEEKCSRRALALTELRWGQMKQKNGVEKEGWWYFGLQYQPILLYLSLAHQLRVPSVQQAGVHLHANRAACSSCRGDPSSDKRHYLKNNSTEAFLSSLQTPKWDAQVVRLKKWREHFFFFHIKPCILFTAFGMTVLCSKSCWNRLLEVCSVLLSKSCLYLLVFHSCTTVTLLVWSDLIFFTERVFQTVKPFKCAVYLFNVLHSR